MRPNDYLPVRETIMAVLIVLGAMAVAVLCGGCATAAGAGPAAPQQPVPWNQDALHTSPHLPLCCQCHTPEYDD